MSLAPLALTRYMMVMNQMARKNMHIPDEVLRLVGDVLHQARFRSETQAVIAMLEGASDRLREAEGYVYLMRGEKGLKIGTSIQPNVRAVNLKSQLLYCIPGDRLTELAVHIIWGRYRLSARGEWFEDTPEILAWFAEHELLVSLDELENGGKKPLGTAIDPALWEEVDQWVKDNAPWRKVDAIEKALRDFLDSQPTTRQATPARKPSKE